MNRMKLMAVAFGGALLVACGSSDAAGQSITAAATPTLVSTSTAAASPSPSATTVPAAATPPAPTASQSPTAEPTKPAPTAAHTPVAQPATPAPLDPTPLPPTQAPPSVPLARSVGITEFNQFSPASVTVAAGGTVTWAWNSAQYHDITGLDFKGSSDTAKSGSYSMTFPNPGTYRYECQVHSYAGMTGTVIVQ